MSERAILQNKELKNTMLSLEHMKPEDPHYEATLQSLISKTNEHMEEEVRPI